MQTLEIEGRTGRSRILVGERLQHLARYLPPGKVIVITDQHVQAHYGAAMPTGEVVAIGSGEKVKSMATVEHLYGRLVALGADRSSFVVAIGGGLVCDVAGFVAATFMRGIRFGFVASTLLAQVDASVGGKNGVNFKGYKNIIGMFRQPEFVLCDLDLLQTLPAREIASGFAEIIKHAAIADAGLFEFLEAHSGAAWRLEREVLEKIIYSSVHLKASIVNRDETEKGERKLLNFGHTFGHAIEKTAGVAHGEAVSAGMVLAARLSVKKGLLTPAAADRLEALIAALHLPTRLAFDRHKALDALRKDKKRSGGAIDFVLLDGIGRAVIREIALEELKAAAQELMAA